MRAFDETAASLQVAAAHNTVAQLQFRLTTEHLVSLLIRMSSLFLTWYTWSQRVEDEIVLGHEKVARSIAKRPFIWMISVSVIAAICCIGLIEVNVRVELYIVCNLKL